ncbi:hypothetical protein D3C75_1268520 [compost metagenome]
MLVDLIGDHQDSWVFLQNRTQGGKFFPTVDRATGIIRRVEHQPACLRRNRRFQPRSIELEAILGAAGNDLRHTTIEQHHVGVGHPIRRRRDDLVA